MVQKKIKYSRERKARLKLEAQEQSQTEAKKSIVQKQKPLSKNQIIKISLWEEEEEKEKKTKVPLKELMKEKQIKVFQVQQTEMELLKFIRETELLYREFKAPRENLLQFLETEIALLL